LRALAHRRKHTVESTRGSRFYLCRLAETDTRFVKYPTLAVLRCDGYMPDKRVGPSNAGRKASVCVIDEAEDVC